MEKEKKKIKTKLELEKEEYEGRAIGALRSCMQNNMKSFLDADYDLRRAYLKIAEDENERHEKLLLQN